MLQAEQHDFSSQATTVPPMFPAFLTANVLQTAGFNIVLLRFGPTQFCKFSPFLEILSPISLTANLCKFHFVFRMLGSKH
jgi:hypothetical protein